MAKYLLPILSVAVEATHNVMGHTHKNKMLNLTRSEAENVSLGYESDSWTQVMIILGLGVCAIAVCYGCATSHTGSDVSLTGESDGYGSFHVRDKDGYPPNWHHV